MATLTEQLKWLVTADGSKAISAFENVGKSADKNLGKAEDRLNKLSAGFTKAGAGMLAGAGLLGGGLIKAAGSFEKLGVAVGKFAATTGTTTEQASRLIEVTGSIGLSSDDLATSLNFMNKTLGKTPAIFDKYGVAVARAKDGTENVQGTFLNVVDRLNAIPDAGDRAAAATALLGKGWKNLSTLIEQGSSQIQTSMAAVSDGQVISPAEAASAKAYQAALDNLHDSFQNLTLAIGKGAAPVLGDIAKVISTGVDAFTKLDAITGGVAGKIAAIGAVGLAAAGGLSLVVGASVKVGTNLSILTTKLGLHAAAGDADASATATSAAASEAKVGALAAETAAVEANTGAVEANAAAQSAGAGAGAGGGVGLAGLGLAVGAIAVGVGEAASLIGSLDDRQIELAKHAKAVSTALDGEVTSLLSTKTAAGDLTLGLDALNRSLTGDADAGTKAFGQALASLGLSVGDAVPLISELQAGLATTPGSTDGATAALLKLVTATGAFVGTEGDVVNALEVGNGSWNDAKGQLEAYAASTGGLTDVQLALAKSLFTVFQAAKDNDLSKTVGPEILSLASDYGTVGEAALKAAEKQTGLSRNGKDLLPLYVAFTDILRKHADATTALVTGYDDADAALARLGGQQAKAASQQELANQSAAEGAGLLGDLSAAQAYSAKEAQAAGVAWKGYADALAGINTASDKVARESQYLAASLAQVADAATGSERANLNLDDSYAKLADARKANGKTVAEDTQKGRDNQRAILDTADAIRNNLVQQLQDSGGSYEQVTRAADMYRGQLKDQLKQFGITGAAADEYIAKLGLAPDQITTTITLAGQAKAKDDLAALNVSLDDIPADKKTEYIADLNTGDYEAALQIIKTETAKLDPTITPQADLATARRQIHSLDGTVIPVNLRAAAGQIYGTGTPAAKPGLAKVAELGPEIIEGKDGAKLVKKPSLVVLKGGERVYTAAETAAILRGLGAAAGMSVPGYAGGAGGRPVQNVTHVTTLPAAPPPASATASSPSTDAEDQVKEQDRIQAAMYETGRISLAAYQDYVQGRLAASKDLSTDYLDQYRLLKQLNDDAVKGVNDQIAAQDELQKNMHDLGVTTDADYKAYLDSRLGNFQAYTNGYTDIYKQIKQIDDDEAAAQKKKIDDAGASVKALYELAQAAKDAGTAQADQASAFNDVMAAGTEGDRVQKDRHASSDDKAAAVQKLIDSQVKLGEQTYRSVLASASAAGLDVGSLDWDRFVRAAIADYLGQYGDLPYTTGVLQTDLDGIPALAAGGVVKARPGGTLVRAGEGGSDEAVVPLNGQYGNTVNHYHITVNAQTVTGKLDPRVGDMLVEAIATADRRNGRQRWN